MPPIIALLIIAIVSYLIGAIPFGYIIGRLKGKNLFLEGSGNIGATNAGRVLGKPFGILVFTLDFLKGAIPTAVAPIAFRTLTGSDDWPLGYANLDRVAAAACSFLGHLFPVYLGFRGGKGVATGAGAALVVAPIPAVLAVLAWITVVLASRMVSLASIIAAVVLIGVRVLLSLSQSMEASLAATLFCLIGGVFVIIKHRSNVQRIIERKENQISPFPTALGGLHLLALGLAFGGAAFFNFVSAPTIFDSFDSVVRSQPSDRTANITIIPTDTPTDQLETKQKQLASALAGSAVGPIFPKYFVMIVVCGIIALVTSIPWRPLGRTHKIRTLILLFAVAIAIVGWPLSAYVSQLRFDRFAADVEVATSAKSLFGPVHLVSLALSALGTILNGIALAMAGRVPQETR